MIGLSFLKSHYSLLESNINIKDALAYASDLSYEYVALADTNNLHGALEFIVNCKKTNIKPILGMEINIFDDVFGGKVLIFAKSNKGFKNLQQISTEINVHNIKINWDFLKKYCTELVLIINPKNMKSILNELSTSIKFISKVKKIFNDVFLSIETDNENIICKKIIKLGQVSETRVIIANSVLFIEKENYIVPEILSSIKNLKKANLESNEFKNNYMKSPAEINKNWKSDFIQNTNDFFQSVFFVFELDKTTQPDFETPKDKTSFLKDLCLNGLKKKLNLNKIPPKYSERLEMEIAVILKLNFQNYFLIVWDFIKYANDNGIAVGPGRGSAAGSLVSFALNITKVDPIKYNLLFERFLNIERVTMPDIDIDFEDKRREEVINYIVEKYGFKNVAYISTFQSIGARMAIRDVGRSIGIPVSQIDLLTKKVPNKPNMTIQQALDMSISFRKEASKSMAVEKIIKLAKLIEGSPRQLGTHAAGIVMSNRPLEEIVPLTLSKNNNVLQIQYSMHHLEMLGLLKMDFLGIKNLTTIKNIVNMVKESLDIEIDINKIPLNDMKTFKLLSSGLTEGLFQLESPGMKEVLKGLKPRSIEDLSAVIALYRPGPMSNIPLYIKRRDGKEPISYLHEDLKPILKHTYGIIVYQEQIMQIAKEIAGFSYSKADILRKAMSKKDVKDIIVLEEEFISGAKLRGYNFKMADEIYKLIYKFANYGFNSAHSISYSIIGYQLAYLKAHYPKLFLVALLTTNAGNDEKLRKYIYETKKLGIKISCPSINVSTHQFIYENSVIYLPLTLIKNVGNVIAKSIIEIRQKTNGFKNYTKTISILSKNGINKKTIESLIEAGAFDEFNYSRTALKSSLSDFIKYVGLLPEENTEKIISTNLIPKPRISNLKDDLEKTLELEYENLGYYISSHPIEILKNKILKTNKGKIRSFAEIWTNSIYVRTAILAMVKSMRTIKTKKGAPMIFLTLEDESGESEAVVFPRIFEKVGHKISYNKIFGFTGKYDRKNHTFVIEDVKLRNEIIR